MSTKITINIDANKIISKLHLEHGGTAERFMTSEIYRLSDKYVPFDTGILKSNVALTANSITYNSPYAKYQYNGLSKNGKHLKYYGAPLRGKQWTVRMMADRRKDVVKAVKRFIESGAN